jgi:hypothetical protein
MPDKMKDLTESCLLDMENKYTESQLRRRYCRQCRNPECGNSVGLGSLFAKRMQTQEDVLLNNPLFADETHPKYFMLREIDFPEMLQEAIRLETADKKGDWEVPTVDDQLSLIDGTLKESSKEEILLETQPSNMVEVESESDINVIYLVELDTQGHAIKCSCRAGQLSRPCKHLKQAEVIFKGLPDEDQKIKEEVPAPNVLNKNGTKIRSPFKNTSVPPGGILLQGHKEVKAEPEEDPWEPKKEIKVEVGTKIKMQR